ncbi:plant virulence effector HPE1-like domain-containing protein [Ensifer adhaerens]|uniref:plant virulence effector HPE1-like domain-containing protein n=1 Tax=Ensifer adhaerens TaxID=106592 RepID=UPI00098F7EBF|nr:plant virulence effector HPE1-like domain-containing protein [Ensifer adhaerens]
MRLLLITTVLGLAAGNAAASSIEAIASGTTDNASVSTVSCADCPPLQSRKKVTYVVPTIAAGDETVELKKINGEMKMVRTEAWLGGSPVVFVSKPSHEMIKTADAETDDAATVTVSNIANDQNPQDDNAELISIDETAQTAAVTPIGASMAASPAADEGSQHFDPATLELRLN